MTDVSSIALSESANVQTGVPTVSDGSRVRVITLPSLAFPEPSSAMVAADEVGATMSYVNDSDVSGVAAFPDESLTATEKV